jgi:hypothetical protein
MMCRRRRPAATYRAALERCPLQWTSKVLADAGIGEEAREKILHRNAAAMMSRRKKRSFRAKPPPRNPRLGEERRRVLHCNKGCKAWPQIPRRNY